MKLITSLLTAVMAIACLSSCNEKPRHYTFIQNMSDGKQIVEQIDAKNDTVALNLFLDRMTKAIVDNLEDSDSTSAKVESTYIISPDGDTLNTNLELTQAIEKQILNTQKKGAIPTR